MSITACWMSTGGATFLADPEPDTGDDAAVVVVVAVVVVEGARGAGWDGGEEECGLPGPGEVGAWGTQAVATARRMRASQNSGKRISSGLVCEHDRGLAVALTGRFA